MDGGDDDDFSDSEFSDDAGPDHDDRDDQLDDDGSFDDDDEFDESVGDGGGGGGGGGRGNGEAKSGGATLKSKQLSNQHYDAVVDLDDEGSLDDEVSVDTNDMASPKLRDAKPSNRDGQDRGDSPPRGSAGGAGNKNDSLSESEDAMDFRRPGRGDESMPAAHGMDDVDRPRSRNRGGGGRGVGGPTAIPSKVARPRKAETDESSDDDADSSQAGGGGGGSGEGSSGAAAIKSGYNPDDFKHLNVSGEVKELFQYIGRYKPHNIELDTRLRCFIPDYIPAVGEIDAFIKVPRPDMKADDLGLKVLDEPSSNQSDPTVLDLQLRAISKKSNLEPMVVRSIPDADKNPKQIANWIKSINELHRSKPPPQVHYANSMPDIEALMQVWPEEIESLLKQTSLPSAEMDLDLKDYCRVVCAILDIPVYASMTDSLHVLFTLYSEFKTNQHFNAGAGGGALGGPVDPSEGGAGMGYAGDLGGLGLEGKM